MNSTADDDGGGDNIDVCDADVADSDDRDGDGDDGKFIADPCNRIEPVVIWEAGWPTLWKALRKYVSYS